MYYAYAAACLLYETKNDCSVCTSKSKCGSPHNVQTYITCHMIRIGTAVEYYNNILHVNEESDP